MRVASGSPSASDAQVQAVSVINNNNEHQVEQSNENNGDNNAGGDAAQISAVAVVGSANEINGGAPQA